MQSVLQPFVPDCFLAQSRYQASNQEVTVINTFFFVLSCVKCPILCSCSGPYIHYTWVLEMFTCFNVKKKTLFFSYCSLLQHLYSCSFLALSFSASLFKTPPSHKARSGLIGQLSQAQVGSSHLVSTSTLVLCWGRGRG